MSDIFIGTNYALTLRFSSFQYYLISFSKFIDFSSIFPAACIHGIFRFLSWKSHKIWEWKTARQIFDCLDKNQIAIICRCEVLVPCIRSTADVSRSPNHCCYKNKQTSQAKCVQYTHKKVNEINERDTLSQARHLRLTTECKWHAETLLIPIFYARDESFHYNCLFISFLHFLCILLWFMMNFALFRSSFAC